MSHTIEAAIVGPTGYTGLELIEILLSHPVLRVGYLASARAEPVDIRSEFPRLRGRVADDIAVCGPIDHDAIAERCRIVFLCLPHEAAMEHAPKFVSRGVRVVDLSAAYRIREKSVYESAYGHAHTDDGGRASAVYGLTEHNRDAVRHAALVANPGCYPTAAAIALVPLIKEGLIDPSDIVVNAASGVSGAGRGAKGHLLLAEAGENYSAYGIGVHRHQPEITQTLNTLGGAGGSADVLFVPHLLPIERGILETIYVRPTDKSCGTEVLQAALRRAYEDEPFVVVREDTAPAIRDVSRTNAVHVNARVIGSGRGSRAVIVAAIDNLVKGASGQAVQNANVMLGLDETAGLWPTGGSRVAAGV